MIVHGCNAMGKINAGFAAEIRRRYPIAYLEYYQLHLRKELHLGSSQIIYTKNQCIFNAVTQATYGRDPNVVYVNYDALRKCVREANQAALLLDVRVYLPFIGVGLGNGDPSMVYQILQEEFSSVDAYLVLAKDYSPGELTSIKESKQS